MRELFSRMMSFLLVLFISCFFCLGETIDCGGDNVTETIIVGKEGKAAFRTVQEAIDSVKNNNDQWVKIHIQAGLYIERVTIPTEKPCIILEGEGNSTTTISYSDHRSINNNSTFTSLSSNVIASGITFKNSYNVDIKTYKSYYMGSRIEPANAVRLHGDKYFFYNCSFLGYQDTLYDQYGRHYFKDCYIQGEVDFIYGSGQSYYENCWINVVGRSPNLAGFVTAQGRSSRDDPDGFVFEGGFLIGNGKVNLGRAWSPYSRVIFHKTYFSSIVTPQGWNAWHYVGNENGLTYAEVDCEGPGADTSKRVSWLKKLNNSEMKAFSLTSFINNDGWVDNLPKISS
ncbi:hypothetical protein PHAVU_008G271500 [Phaseolus vulgaris]